MEKLEDLVISGKEIDQSLVTEILAPYLRLDKDTCSIRPTAEWDSFSNKAKVMLYLIARKAMKALDFALESEEASPSDIAKETGMKRGSVFPTVRELSADRLIEQTRKLGGYLVPNHALQRIRSMIQEERKVADE